MTFKEALETATVLLAFNAVLYYFFTTSAARSRHHRRIRAFFFAAHRKSYLGAAKKGSSYFLTLLNRIFGEVSDPLKFFSSSYFSPRMTRVTFTISYSYVGLSLLYFDYLGHDFFVVQTLLDSYLDKLPILGDKNEFLPKLSHIGIALWIIKPVLLLAASAILAAKYLKSTRYSWLICLVFIGISHAWMQSTANISTQDFESPVYIPLQFIVHGSARFESLIGDIYLILLLGVTSIILGIYWGTASSILFYLIVGFRRTASYGIELGFSSPNFAFWFDRIVASISKATVFFLMPLANFITDAASINASRFLFFRLKTIGTWTGFFSILIIDLVFALLAFAATPAVLLALAASIDALNIWEFGSKKLSILLWNDISSVLKGQGDNRSWWVLVMLISTLLPTIAHFFFVLVEMTAKLIEPAVRIIFYRGHYVLREAAAGEETPIVKFKISGPQKTVLLITISLSAAQLAIYFLLLRLLA